jgi:Sec-independent protein translocase protein TatA
MFRLTNEIFFSSNVVELQHVNQKLDKMLREMRSHTSNVDEDLNRTRFDELKKDHQQQQEKFKEMRNQFDAVQTQVDRIDVRRLTCDCFVAV